ncbi:MAG TPA: HPr family phosphocarrier protein [Propionibacteriaceae bacterium]|nr:HPr family phosphocarrier protein [Propionibacteriaceae bacterium]
MPSRTTTVAAPEGLHARPASEFVKAAKATGLKVTISKDDGPAVDATSILSVMGLGAGQGATVTLTAEGDDADAKLDALVDLVSHVE